MLAKKHISTRWPFKLGRLHRTSASGIKLSFNLFAISTLKLCLLWKLYCLHNSCKKILKLFSKLLLNLFISEGFDVMQFIPSTLSQS